MQPDSTQTHRLLQRIEQGDRGAFDRLFARHHAYLTKVVQRRIDPRLQPRVDPSDVVQDAQLEAFRRIDDYLKRRPMPFRLWLVKTTHQRLRKTQRYHLQAAKRSLKRELPLPERSSLALARAMVADSHWPSRLALRRELVRQVRLVLAQLSEKDREVVLLRNFEGMTNSEVAGVLEITPEAAKKRYARALLRLRRPLIDLGLMEK